jgi:hypothetical protein
MTYVTAQSARVVDRRGVFPGLKNVDDRRTIREIADQLAHEDESNQLRLGDVERLGRALFDRWANRFLGDGTGR